MIKNYLKIAIRNLRKHSGYTLLNVVGLAVGLTCALFVLLYVRDELSYDRFHDNADRIYRVSLKFSDMGEFARAPVLTAPYLEETYPEVERAVRFYTELTVLEHDDTIQNEERFFYTDASIFEVFDFPLMAGDPATALQEPGTVVITETTARRYFGEQAAVGQTLTRNDGTSFRVTGVMEDVPPNAHFHFDFLASFASLGELQGYANQSYTYVLLSEGARPAMLQQKIDTFTDQGFEEVFKVLAFGVDGMAFNLQPLTSIHLYSNLGGEAEPTSDVRYLYIFSAIGLFILLIAAINYMNLATARSARRAREVGVRKVLGAGRGQLIRQFLSESMLLSVGAFVLALVLIELLLPFFNNLTGKMLVRGTLYQPDVLVLFALVVLVVGLVAGSYPAFYLTRFKPVRVLKGTLSRQAGGVWIRRGLVTFQFAISVALICGTGIVLGQMDYIQSKRLGYDTEQLMTVWLKGDLKEQPEAFKEELARIAGIEQVSIAALPMGGMMSMSGEENEQVKVRYLTVDADYLETMGMTLVEGRNFDPNLASDSSTVLLNETAARIFGVTDQVGEIMESPHFRNEEKRLAGIVSDFHVESLHAPIMPTVLNFGASDYSGSTIIRFDPARTAEMLTQVEAVWKQFVPSFPFSYRFLDDMVARQYEAEQRLASLFSIFALLAIGIACLGLFGLAAYTAEQRTKEIGIRKVLGATVSSLVLLLSKEFMRLVMLAIGLGMPVAYLAVHRWLEDFAYRMDLVPGPFVLAGGIVMALAVGTVSYQAIKAALADPVKSLRYE